MKSEFIHLQYIRNPKQTENISSNYIAFDYFDYIYAKKENDLKACMEASNDIPCEAYQKLSIFKTDIEDEDKNLSFEFNDKNLPFISILHITVVPCKKDYLKNAEKELEDCVKDLINSLSEKFNTEELKICYRIYKSVNSMDFCIVIFCNMLEFSLHLSNKIDSLIDVKNKSNKYVVYTVMGVHKDISPESDIIIEDNSILVVRVRLNRKLWGSKDAWKQMRDALNSNELETHNLVGRYDLSIRITKKERILHILSKLVDFKEKNFEKISRDVKNNTEDILLWLIGNDYAEYVNERILFSPYLLPNSPSTNIPEGNTFFYDMGEIEKLRDCYNSLIEHLEKSKYPFYNDIIVYMRKLKNIINICIGLDSIYDMRVNIWIFKNHILNFMSLFKLACEAIDQNEVKNWNDIIINFVHGLDYLQQFMKIVTSINSSSYQSPKYDIVQQECSIEKFPIAYSEFISEMCDLHYNMRKNKKDPEFEYFPKYNVMLIPYMMKDQIDFTMTILFSQGISYNWDLEKHMWKDYTESNGEVPIFVTCQNLETYLNVSGVVVSSFHELGHYCNSVTREYKNETVLKIAASLMTKWIIKSYVLSSVSLVPAQLNALNSECFFQKLNNLFYESLVKNMREYLKKYSSSPSIVFMENLSSCINNILKSNNCYFNTAESQKKYLDYLQESLKYRFNITVNISKNEYSIDVHKKFLEDAVCELYKLAKTIKEKILRYDEKSEVLNMFLDRVNYFLKDVSDDVLKMLFVDDEDSEDISEEICKLYDLVLEKCRNSEILVEVRNLIGIIEYIGDSLNEFSNILYHNYQHIIQPDYVDINKVNKQIINDIIDELPKIIDKFKNAKNVLMVDLYNKLFLISDETYESLKKAISEAFLKADLNMDELEVWHTSYNESLADITMCLNLNLDINEYLAFVSNIYPKYNIDADEKNYRIILVSLFLFIKNDSEMQNKKLYDLDYKYVSKKFRDCISNIKNSFPVIKELCAKISKYMDDKWLLGNSTFDIILNSLMECSENIVFLDKKRMEELSFVKKYLNKLVDNSCEAEIETQEIDFIFKYYYKTREKYLEDVNKGNGK